LMCILASIAYGIAHDSVTARVCVEYFTVFHPDLFGTQSPTLLALGWGIVATWWMGLLLGIPLAVVARVGSGLKLGARDFLRPIGILLVIMGAASLAAGLIGYELATRDPRTFHPPEPWDQLIPVESHARFLADLCSHQAAYATGFLGGVFI